MIAVALVVSFVVLQGLSWDPYTDDSAELIRLYYDPGGLAYWTPLADISPAIGGGYEVELEIPIDTNAPCTDLPIGFMVRAVDTARSPELVSTNSNVVHQTWLLASGTTLRDFASCAGVDICPPCLAPAETCPDGCACVDCP